MDWDPPETWSRMAAWLRGLGETLPVRPRAIVVVSAHWEADEFTVTANPAPGLRYDYSGFPEHTYHLTYDVPGSPELARQIKKLVAAAGIPLRKTTQRGFDHGVFIPFKLIYPDADIPIVQLSLKAGLDPAAHLAIGEALAPLRDDGVLLVGSGMSYHNLRVFFGLLPAAAADSILFDAWLRETVGADPVARKTALCHWSDVPTARAAHPREEHLLPLMVVAGAALTDPGDVIFRDHVMGITLSAFRFS